MLMTLQTLKYFILYVVVMKFCLVFLLLFIVVESHFSLSDVCTALTSHGTSIYNFKFIS